ncbi:NADP-dependent oxidoreductase [Novosphingobium lentum]|uniref:NADP-dependent oxidoreductase n=1 Tax=Novosphingobium lentum TaxID=145287 RepID=UPI00082F89DA|nr:NADP-dependent oxidoreductase [Novosphingobium lentum]
MSGFLPEYSTPATNRRVLLTSRPEGIPQASHFALDEAPLDPVGDGQFRVRNVYLSVDPAQRGWVNAIANYSDPVAIGSVMRALAVGVVVESRNADVPVGLHLYGWFGWQDYAVVGPEAIMTRIDTVAAPLSAYAGMLGMNGLTAWLAFTRIGRAEPGETVLVTTAAGAVGSTVGQLAREAGCRVVGLTGDDGKVARCTQRFGYDAAANYKAGDVADLIKGMAPDGIDVFFDNVGGPMMDTAIRQMRVNGRIVQCGTASIANWSPPPHGPRNEREVLMRRLQWGGFVIFDHTARYAQAMAALEALLASGKLVHDEDIATGFDAAPGAIARLYAGENEGKALIFVG